MLLAGVFMRGFGQGETKAKPKFGFGWGEPSRGTIKPIRIQFFKAFIYEWINPLDVKYN